MYNNNLCNSKTPTKSLACIFQSTIFFHLVTLEFVETGVWNSSNPDIFWMKLHAFIWYLLFLYINYRQVSNISRTLVGNKLLITQMELEHRLSALLQLHLHSQLNTFLQWIDQRQLQDETRNIYVWGLGVPYIRDLMVYSRCWSSLVNRILNDSLTLSDCNVTFKHDIHDVRLASYCLPFDKISSTCIMPFERHGAKYKYLQNSYTHTGLIITYWTVIMWLASYVVVVTVD